MAIKKIFGITSRLLMMIVAGLLILGLWMLFGGVGAIFGIGGTLGTQALLKKR